MSDPNGAQTPTPHDALADQFGLEVANVVAPTLDAQRARDMETVEVRAQAKNTHDDLYAKIAALVGQVAALAASIAGLATKTSVDALSTAYSAVVASVTALGVRVGALEAKVPAYGSVTVASGLIGAGATREVTVPLTPTLPNTSYGVMYSLEYAASVLGNVSWSVKPASKTTSSVIVLVKNSALLTLGAEIKVNVQATP